MTDDQLRAEVARVDAEYLSRLTDSELAELSASREIFVTKRTSLAKNSCGRAAEMKAHPYADLFPLLEGAELQSLADDIATNGLREKIWLYEGKILDGRNRWAACKLAKVEPQTREYRGSDPLGLVVSLNLKRRHLNESQRGMIAARLATLKQGRPQSAEKTKESNRKFPGYRPLSSLDRRH